MSCCPFLVPPCFFRRLSSGAIRRISRILFVCYHFSDLTLLLLLFPGFSGGLSRASDLLVSVLLVVALTLLLYVCVNVTPQLFLFIIHAQRPSHRTKSSPLLSPPPFLGVVRLRRRRGNYHTKSSTTICVHSRSRWRHTIQAGGTNLTISTNGE